jgi:hypothetical protein
MSMWLGRYEKENRPEGPPVSSRGRKAVEAMTTTCDEARRAGSKIKVAENHV